MAIDKKPASAASGEADRSTAFRGVFPMLPTPFDHQGRVDLDALRPLVEHVIAQGADGVAALGLAGEVRTLALNERRAIAERVLACVARRCPVLIGASADSMADAMALARHAAELGADLVMVSPPASPGIGAAELIDHFVAVAEAASFASVMLQDAPADLGVALTPEVIGAIVARSPNVRYAKMEGAPAGRTTAALRASPAGERLRFFGGNGGLHLIDMLDAGAVGTIPGAEAVAGCVAILERFNAGDRAAAVRLYEHHLPLWVFENQAPGIFVAAVKEILARQGVLASTVTRLGLPLDDWSRAALFRHAAPLGIAPLTESPA